MCEENTGEGKTIPMTVSIGWETVREVTLGSSHSGAYSLTETDEHSKTHSTRYKCHKRGIKYYRDSEDINCTSTLGGPQKCLKQMKYEWAFRKLLHLSRTEGRGYKHQLPAPCRETS